MTLDSHIEDIYELSPLQLGMLFHNIYAPEASTYFEQHSTTLNGPLDLPTFKRAWETVVARYGVLRTSFYWEEIEKPLQVVHRHVDLPFEFLDWRGLSPDQQQHEIEVYLANDLRRGFDPSVAPLMRLTLIRLKDFSYRFIWSHHHILMDGWSVHKVTSEVSALYEAYYSGHDLELAPARPYVDYIAWLQEQDLTEAKVFWQQALQDLTTHTILAVDRSPNALPGPNDSYEEQQTRLSEEMTHNLQEFARQNQFTFNTLVQGAWALLLSRYSGEQDIVFGVTVSGRPPELLGVESTVGLFINTLPLRVQIPMDDDLLSWLKYIQKQQVLISEYEYSPLVRVHEWSELPPGTPLFNSIFVFENYPGLTLLSNEGGEAQSLGFAPASERLGYPLSILVTPGPALSFKIIYNSERFDRLTVTRMLRYLETFLSHIAVNPSGQMRDLPLLTPEEEQLFITWNATKADYPDDVCIHQLVEAQVNRTPEAVAAIFEQTELTYQELNRRSNQLSHQLRDIGIGPGSLVGICMQPSMETAVGLLAVLKAGAGYVPLDPAYPQERLAFMLRDAWLSVLLTKQNMVDRLPPHDARLVLVDADWSEIELQSETNPINQANADDLLYVIYTSGSTGKPKGVEMTHRPLCNLLSWQARNSVISNESRTLQLASLSFDVSFQEIFYTWSTGGTLVIVPEQTRRDPSKLLEFMEEHGIERVFLPFSALQQMAETAISWRPIPSSLREVITAGEQLQITQPIVALFEKIPACTLHNQYGPTESHVVTAYTLEGSSAQWPALPAIGIPVANTQIYLLDAQMQPVPIGVAGELYIGGNALARGYLNRPGLTAERFVPDPFGARAGARLYRTGDLARYQPDGKIEFLGRNDLQVKIRGFRIELGEIEAVLGRHQAVQRVAVVASDDTIGDRRLIAYIVHKDGESLSVSGLRDFLKQHLPDFMLPSAFVLLDSLPMTPSGKIDRRALLLQDGAVQSTLDQPYVAPRNAVEEVLAGIWAEVLKLERVGIYDNFFELGGHSLLATRLVSKIRSLFNVEFPLRHLFNEPTIASLAETLTADLPLAARVEETAELLLIVRDLSDEEVDAILRSKSNQEDEGLTRTAP